MTAGITPRQQTLLASIINEYIRTAEPVSSKFLEKSGFFGLKSATIRGEMNDLEEHGYLSHLYTSSGRVPTDRAYRYFVDNLLSVRRKGQSEKDKKEIKNAISAAGHDPHQINKNVAQILAELSDNLVITNILEEDDFFKIGLASLFEMPEFREFDKLFRLTSFFDEFEQMFSRIEKNFFDDSDRDFRIFIGRENPVKNIRDETVMFARYNLPDDRTGSLTLVGPTRMDYAKNIGLIRFTADELNKIAKRA